MATEKIIGIYCIQHVASGKRYIGKSVDVARRLAEHKAHHTNPIFNPKYANSHLHNAVQKYGWDAFESSVLESFADVDADMLAQRELAWIDLLRTCDRRYGFNLKRDSDSISVVHEETRRKISEAHKGRPKSEEHRRNIAKGQIGRVQSEETRRKISEWRTGRPGPKQSEETKRKRAQSQIGRQYSEETRRKMSESQKARFARNKVAA